MGRQLDEDDEDDEYASRLNVEERTKMATQTLLITETHTAITIITVTIAIIERFYKSLY